MAIWTLVDSSKHGWALVRLEGSTMCKAGVCWPNCHCIDWSVNGGCGAPYYFSDLSEQGVGRGRFLGTRPCAMIKLSCPWDRHIEE